MPIIGVGIARARVFCRGGVKWWRLQPVNNDFPCVLINNLKTKNVVKGG